MQPFIRKCLDRYASFGLSKANNINNFLEESALLIKRVGKTIKDEAKEQKGRFLGIRHFGAILLGNLLTGKGTIKAGEGTIRDGQYS